MKHVAEQRLEDFARQDCLALNDFAEVQEHLATCPVCQERLNDLTEFVAFMRAAPCDTEGQILRRHDTDQGTVFLIITGADASQWEARALGGGVDVVCVFLRGAQAKGYLEEWFSSTFGGHRCSSGCSADWK